MSESERKRRANYRRRRRIALTTLAILLVVVTLAVAVVGFALYQINKTIYINYTEQGSLDYTVDLKPNDFYSSASLPSGQSYVASLIDGINAHFSYTLQTQAQNVSYQYSYWLDTQLLITDASTGAAIYDPTFPVKEKQTLTQNAGSKLTITQAAAVDYAYYNELAESFIKTYALSGAQSRLITRMHVSVLSLCEDFRESEQSEYVITLSVPLTGKTVNVEMSSTVPSAESKILACENDAPRELLINALTVCGISDIVLLLAFVLVALLTRNKDISYSIKLKKLLSAYRSFIQCIQNPFNTDGYQVLYVNSFNEMLEIRDTINSPVLMHENEDHTCARFTIPGPAGLLYIYELKVADYDEIYGTPEELVAHDAPAEHEDLVVKETHGYEQESTVELAAEIEEISAEQTNSFQYGPGYSYSFAARLALAEDDAKEYWRTIVTYARSFGVKVSRSWERERIHLGRNIFAMITFKGKRLAISFANPPEPVPEKYRVTDMSSTKKFERTPLLMRVSSPRKLKYAIELLHTLFTAAGLTDKKLSVQLEPVDHRTKEELLCDGLIRLKNR
ncbi:MAG: hypothetical protein J6U87_02425 [Clostridia bacterium]|nr:hypothetical protein [Clostridia bacterium]